MSEIDAVLHEWINICGVDDLNPNSGVCAIVIKEQVAVCGLQLRSRWGCQCFVPWHPWL